MGMGDVMQYLKVSRQYIDRLVEQGKLRWKQTSTGKVLLFSDVVAFQKTRDSKKRSRK
jgi:predicted site-specific integrase-resolvase